MIGWKIRTKNEQSKIKPIIWTISNILKLQNQSEKFQQSNLRNLTSLLSITILRQKILMFARRENWYHVYPNTVFQFLIQINHTFKRQLSSRFDPYFAYIQSSPFTPVQIPHFIVKGKSDPVFGWKINLLITSMLDLWQYSEYWPKKTEIWEKKDIPSKPN